jgi:AmmeMemoRadiSam system protein B
LEFNICEACGGGGIVAAMKTADLLNKKNSLILNRSDSGDVTGDNSEVVGYLSAVIY